MYWSLGIYLTNTLDICEALDFYECKIIVFSFGFIKWPVEKLMIKWFNCAHETCFLGDGLIIIVQMSDKNKIFSNKFKFNMI